MDRIKTTVRKERYQGYKVEINVVAEKLFKFSVQGKGVFLEIGFKKVQTYKSRAMIQPSFL